MSDNDSKKASTNKEKKNIRDSGSKTKENESLKIDVENPPPPPKKN